MQTPTDTAHVSRYYFQKFCHCKDNCLFELLEFEQIRVAGHKIIGSTINGHGQQEIILGVSAFMNRRFYLNRHQPRHNKIDKPVSLMNTDIFIEFLSGDDGLIFFQQFSGIENRQIFTGQKFVEPTAGIPIDRGADISIGIENDVKASLFRHRVWLLLPIQYPLQ